MQYALCALSLIDGALDGGGPSTSAGVLHRRCIKPPKPKLAKREIASSFASTFGGKAEIGMIGSSVGGFEVLRVEASIAAARAIAAAEALPSSSSFFVCERCVSIGEAAIGDLGALGVEAARARIPGAVGAPRGEGEPMAGVAVPACCAFSTTSARDLREFSSGVRIGLKEVT